MAGRAGRARRRAGRVRVARRFGGGGAVESLGALRSCCRGSQRDRRAAEVEQLARLHFERNFGAAAAGWTDPHLRRRLRRRARGLRSGHRADRRTARAPGGARAAPGLAAAAADGRLQRSRAASLGGNTALSRSSSRAASAWACCGRTAGSAIASRRAGADPREAIEQELATLGTRRGAAARWTCCWSATTRPGPVRPRARRACSAGRRRAAARWRCAERHDARTRSRPGSPSPGLAGLADAGDRHWPWPLTPCSAISPARRGGQLAAPARRPADRRDRAPKEPVTEQTQRELDAARQMLAANSPCPGRRCSASIEAAERQRHRDCWRSSPTPASASCA